MLPNLSRLQLCSEQIGETIFHLNSETGCKLKGIAHVSPNPDGRTYSLQASVKGTSVHPNMGFESNSFVPPTVYVQGNEVWRKEPCAYSMHWVIQAIVKAIQQEMPAIKSIMYTDIATFNREGIHKMHPETLRKAWLNVSSEEEIRKLIAPHFYRFRYYERLGFEFASPWRLELENETMTLIKMFKEAKAAKAERDAQIVQEQSKGLSEAEQAWNNLFEGSVVGLSWPMFWPLFMNHLVKVGNVFRGDLVEIANRNVPKSEPSVAEKRKLDEK